MVKIKNILVLGMYPYPWHYREISDTMRLMTGAFQNFKKVFLNPSVGFRRARAEGYPFRINWGLKKYRDVLVCTPPLETVPSSYGLGRLKDVWVMKRLNTMVTSLLGPRWREETILYLSSGGVTQSYKTMTTLRPKWTIADVLDDNIGFPGVGEQERNMLKRQFKHILTNATLVTAVSRFLTDRLREDYSVTAELLPNGLDVEKFTYREAYSHPIGELIPLERPLFGFVGALTSWIDFELLWKTAEHLAQGTLVLVGPVVEGTAPRDLLAKLRNHQRVAFLGSKPYDQVPHFLHQFDVLLLPRNYLPHSLASDPLKLYEYLATGKPVVSTALPGVIPFGDIVFIGKRHEDFLTALEKAQKEWTEEKAIRSSKAVENMSWKNRAERITELFLDKCQCR